MSAVEEIETAIEELTRLRDAATPGQRGTSTDVFDTSKVALVAVAHDDDGDYRSAGYIAHFSGRHSERAFDDGMLIAALHRTIDAQLALLEWGRGIYNIPNRSIPSPLETRVLALARAINAK